MSDLSPTPIRTAADVASACLTTFVNASEIKKHTVLSTTGENRSSGTSNGSTGRRFLGQRLQRGTQPTHTQQRGMDTGGKLPELADRVARLLRRRLEKLPRTLGLGRRHLPSQPEIDTRPTSFC